MEPVEAEPVVVKPGKTDGVTVVLLVDAPNMEGGETVEAVEAGLVVVMGGGGCPKPAAAVAAPKMGLKFWTGGLLSGADVAEEEEVAATEKMGLNPEASRGLALLTDSELLAGAVTVTVTGFDVEEAVGVLIWLVNPNRPAPAAGGAPLEA